MRASTSSASSGNDLHESLSAGDDAADGMHIQLLHHSGDWARELHEPATRIGLGFLILTLRGFLVRSIHGLPLFALERGDGALNFAALLLDARLYLAGMALLGGEFMLQFDCVLLLSR